MQYRRHLGLELRVPSLHTVSNLMRSKFSLHQDLMQLGARSFLSPYGPIQLPPFHVGVVEQASHGGVENDGQHPALD
jgi:hypothetical protein